MIYFPILSVKHKVSGLGSKSSAGIWIVLVSVTHIHPHSDDIDNSYKFNIISMIPLIY